MKHYSKKIVFLAILFMLYQTCMANALTLTPYLGGYRFEGNSNVGDTYLMGLGVDYQLTDSFAAELIYLKGNTDLNYLNINTQKCVTQESIDLNIFHISGRYYLFKDKSFMPYVTTGLGVFALNSDYAEMFKDHPDRHNLFQFHYGGGVQYSLTDTISLRGDVRHMISFDNMDNDLSAILGISYTFGRPANKKDNQHDGVSKNTPHTTIKSTPPETQETNESHKPTQEKSEISKHDAEKEIQTKTKQPISKEAHTIKEPTPQSLDGIQKTTDQIAGKNNYTTAQSKSHMHQKTNKELQMAYLDTDQDGVFDHIDKCSNTPPNTRVNMFGCAPDRDRDGVIDTLDHCPNTPAKTQVDQNGCQIKVIIKAARHIETKKVSSQKFQTTIEFDYKSAQVKSTYFKQLAKIKQWMKKIKNPIIILNSHTDNIGSHIYNINLSEKRGDNVKNYLYRHFQIPGHLIKTYSFGETQPIADNASEEGRQKNRRVVIVVKEKMS